MKYIQNIEYGNIEDGNEYVVDSAVDRKWREAFTYSAKWEQE